MMTLDKYVDELSEKSKVEKIKIKKVIQCLFELSNQDWNKYAFTSDLNTNLSNIVDSAIEVMGSHFALNYLEENKVTEAALISKITLLKQISEGLNICSHLLNNKEAIISSLKTIASDDCKALQMNDGKVKISSLHLSETLTEFLLSNFENLSSIPSLLYLNGQNQKDDQVKFGRLNNLYTDLKKKLIYCKIKFIEQIDAVDLININNILIKILEEVGLKSEDIEHSKELEFPPFQRAKGLMNNLGGFYQFFYFISYWNSFKPILSASSEFREGITTLSQCESRKQTFLTYFKMIDTTDKRYSHSQLLYKFNDFIDKHHPDSIEISYKKLVKYIEDAYCCPTELKKYPLRWKESKEEKKILIKRRLEYLRTSRNFLFSEDFRKITINGNESILQPSSSNLIRELYKDYILGGEGIFYSKGDSTKEQTLNIKNTFRGQNDKAEKDDRYLDEKNLIVTDRKTKLCRLKINYSPE